MLRLSIPACLLASRELHLVAAHFAVRNRVEQVRDDVARRDALDRQVSAPAPDAVVITSDELSPADEVDLIITRWIEGL